MLKKTGATASGGDPHWQKTTFLLNTSGQGENVYDGVSGLNDNSTQKVQTIGKRDLRMSRKNPWNERGFWSWYFDGSGVINTPVTNSNFLMGSNDFTVEAWVLPDQLNSQHLVSDHGSQGGAASFIPFYWISGQWRMYITTAGNQWNVSNGARNYTGGQVGRWQHLCVERVSNTIYLYYNGKLTGSIGISGSVATGIQGVYLGGATTNASHFFGYVCGYHFMIGGAKYRGEFDVPSKPFEKTVDTVLLACQDKTWNDNSGFHWSLSRISGSNLSTNSLIPYDSTNFHQYPDGYWAHYFDGNGDRYRYTVDSNLPSGTGQYTLEAWVFCNDQSSNTRVIVDTRNSSNTAGIYIACVNTEEYQLVEATTQRIQCYGRKNNVWQHICVQKGSDNIIRFFIDGNLADTFSSSSYNQTAQNFTVGAATSSSASGVSWSGWISNVRFTHTAVYNSTGFTPSDKPLPILADTKILTCQSQGLMEKASDYAVESDSNTVADSTSGITSTNVVAAYKKSPFTQGTPILAQPTSYWSWKFGGSSGDQVALTSNVDLALTGSFTIDFFFKSSSLAKDGNHYPSLITFPSNGSSVYQVFIHSDSRYIALYNGSSNVVASLNNSIADNVWHHVRIIRDGSNNVTMWLDGTYKNTSTDSNTIGSNSGTLRICGYTASTGSFNGWLHSLRIIKGTNLTAYDATSIDIPTEPSSVTNETKLLLCRDARIIDNSSSSFTLTDYNNHEVYPTTDIPESFEVTKNTISDYERNIKVKVASIGGNKYIYDNTPVADKRIYLTEGIKYKFDLSDSSLSGHPFKLSESYDGTHVKQSGYYSVEFDGTGDDLSLPDYDRVLNIGERHFSIECFFYAHSAGRREIIFSQSNSAGNNYSNILEKQTDNTLRFLTTTSAEDYLAGTTTLSTNTWYWVQVIRDREKEIKVYLNGSLEITLSLSSATIVNKSEDLKIGASQYGLNFDGLISNFRYRVGKGQISSATSTPNSPLTNVTGTKILTCNTHEFLDQADDGFRIKRNGDVAISTTNPFSGGAGTEYTTGVTSSGTVGSSGAYLEITPNTNTPRVLYAYCSSHSGMGGRIDIGKNYVNPYPNSGSLASTANTSQSEVMVIKKNRDFTFEDDYTIEFWFYLIKETDGSVFISTGYFAINIDAENQFNLYFNSSSTSLAVSNLVPRLMSWNHFVLQRHNGVMQVFLNGERSSTTQANTNTHGYNDRDFGVFALPAGATVFQQGFIHDLRITKGRAKYREEYFDLPTAPQALPSQSTGRYSVGFDGSGDSLQVFDTDVTELGANDWQIDYWYYPQATGSLQFGKRASNNGYGTIIIGANTLTPYVRASTTGSSWNSLDTGSIAMMQNAWNHIRVARMSNVWSIWVNGHRSQTGSLTGTLVDNGNYYTIGSGGDDEGQPVTGKISNFRIIVGSHNTTNTETITLPLTPFESVTNTEILACRDNQLIEAEGNDVTYTGDLHVLNANPYDKGYWVWRLSNSGYVSVPSSTNFDFSTGDFTIEYFVRPTGTGGTHYMMGRVPSSGAGASTPFQIYRTTANYVEGYVRHGNGTVTVTSTTALSDTTKFYHIALVRDSGVLRLYIDGIQEDSDATIGTETLVSTTGAVSFGRTGDYNGGYFAGTFSNARIVKGTAVYTSGTAFVPPTGPLDDVSGTVLLLFQYGSPIENSQNAKVSFGGTVMPYEGTVFDAGADHRDVKLILGYDKGTSYNSNYQDESNYKMAFQWQQPYNSTLGSKLPSVGYKSPWFVDGYWSCNFLAQYLGYVRISEVNSCFSYTTAESHTIEFWWKTTGSTNHNYSGDILVNAGEYTNYQLSLDTSFNFSYYIGNTNRLTVALSSYITEGTWHHFAIVHDVSTSTNNYKLFLDGVQRGQFTWTAAVDLGVTDAIRLGCQWRSTGAYHGSTGLMADFRLSRKARYTGTFTPPTAPHVADQYTDALTLQSGTFHDKSKNNCPVSAYGTNNQYMPVMVKHDSPYNLAENVATWKGFDSETYGGSLLLGRNSSNNGGSYGISSFGADGEHGDRFYQLGLGEWTLELWVMPLYIGGSQRVISINSAGSNYDTTVSLEGSNGTLITGMGGSPYPYSGGTASETSGKKPMTWQHILSVREKTDEGYRLKMFQDGVQVGTTNTTGHVPYFNATAGTGTCFQMGQWYEAGGRYFWGYITGVRFIKGQCLHRGENNFIPPTTPPSLTEVGFSGENIDTTITGQIKPLLNFKQAGIQDSTGNANIQMPVTSNAYDALAVEYQKSKFTTGAIKFDGTRYMMLERPLHQFDVGHNDFTLEFWIYMVSFGNQCIWHMNDYAQGDSPRGIHVRRITGQTLSMGVSNNGSFADTVYVATGSLTAYRWHYVAFQRSGSTLSAYLDGTRSNTATKGGNIYFHDADELRIGYWRAADPMYLANGTMIEQLRFTNGVARYSGTTIDIPDSPFPTSPSA